MNMLAEQKECLQCRAAIDNDDSFCRYCGRDQSGKVAWYYHPFWIAVLTVLALGPFSLFLVWRSPKMGIAGRLIATVLVLAFTYYLVVEAVHAYRNLEEILGLFK